MAFQVSDEHSTSYDSQQNYADETLALDLGKKSSSVRDCTDKDSGTKYFDIPGNSFVGRMLCNKDIVHDVNVVSGKTPNSKHHFDDMSKNSQNTISLGDFHQHRNKPNQQDCISSDNVSSLLGAMTGPAILCHPPIHKGKDYEKLCRQGVECTLDEIQAEYVEVSKCSDTKIDLSSLLAVADHDNWFDMLNDLISSPHFNTELNSNVSLIEVMAFLQFVGCEMPDAAIEKLNIDPSLNIQRCSFLTKYPDYLNTISECLAKYEHKSDLVDFLVKLDAVSNDKTIRFNSPVRLIAEKFLGVVESRKYRSSNALFLKLFLIKGEGVVTLLKWHSALYSQEMTHLSLSQKEDSIVKNYAQSCVKSLSCFKVKLMPPSEVFIKNCDSYKLNNSLEYIACNICHLGGKSYYQLGFNNGNPEVARAAAAEESVMFLHCTEHKTTVCTDCITQINYFKFESSDSNTESIPSNITDLIQSDIIFEKWSSQKKIPEFLLNNFKKLTSDFCVPKSNSKAKSHSVPQSHSVPLIVFICYQYLIFGEVKSVGCNLNITALNRLIESKSLSSLCSTVKCYYQTRKLLFWMCEQEDGVKQLREKILLDSFPAWLKLVSDDKISISSSDSSVSSSDLPNDFKTHKLISDCLVYAAKQGIVNIFTQARVELPFLCSQSQFKRLRSPKNNRVASNVNLKWETIAYRLAVEYINSTEAQRFRFYPPNSNIEQASPLTGITLNCHLCRSLILWIDHLSGKVLENKSGNKNFLACDIENSIDICASCAGGDYYPAADNVGASDSVVSETKQLVDVTDDDIGKYKIFFGALQRSVQCPICLNLYENTETVILKAVSKFIELKGENIPDNDKGSGNSAVAAGIDLSKNPLANSRRRVAMKCGHQMCEGCVTSMIALNQTNCPQCRSLIEPYTLLY